MRRRRRLRLRRLNSRKAHGSGRAGGAGRNKTERISGGADLAGRFGLKGEPGPGKGKVLRDFMDRLYEDARRPGFDRDAYLKSMAARGAPEEMVGLAGALLGARVAAEAPVPFDIIGALKDGDYDQAKRLIKEADLRDEDTSMYRFWVLEWEGRMEEALALCENNIVGGGDDMRWINAKANILNQTGRAGEWLELYEGTRKRFRENPDWQAGRARALVAVGRLDEAEKIAVGIMESVGYHGTACVALGELLMARGDHKGAIKMFNRLLDMDENENGGYIGKAEALSATGRYREAVEVCDMRLNESKTSGRLKRVRDRILALADGQELGRLKESPAESGGAGGGDAEGAALTITLLCAMCNAIESAGAVRDLVHRQITEEDAEVRAGTRMLQAAMEQVPDDSQGVRDAFLNAFRAAKSAPVPGVDATRQIVVEELEKFGRYGGITERIYAAAGAFAAAFPDYARAAVRTRAAPKGGIVGFPQSRHDYSANHQMSCPAPPGLSAYLRILNAVYAAVRSDARARRILENAPAKSWQAAAQKIAERAAAPDATLPLCAAAAAVLASRMQGMGTRYIGESIRPYA